MYLLPAFTSPLHLSSSLLLPRPNVSRSRHPHTLPQSQPQSQPQPQPQPQPQSQPLTRTCRSQRSVPCAALDSAPPAAANSPATALATSIVHRFRKHDAVPPDTARIARSIFPPQVSVLQETCFNIAIATPLRDELAITLDWLLAETFNPTALSHRSQLPTDAHVVELGPRLNFQTAWSSNAVAICHSCGLSPVVRLERSRRYALRRLDGVPIDVKLVDAFVAAVHDRMTEALYETPLVSFDSNVEPVPTYEIDVLARGRDALAEASLRDGLAFDEQDVDYYYNLFCDLRRNPTNVELFDLAQSNSEHSRHWFFKGRLVIDGIAAEQHLFDIVRDTLRANPRNSVIAFADNSSTIRGTLVDTLVAKHPGVVGPLVVAARDRDILFTAETHNFPSGVAPFPGAETGTGGRIRDTAATGVGSLVVAGTAGYSVGNLHIPGHALPWEDTAFAYPDNLASPLEILLRASDGASDYGNKFGEPVINGFARSYGLRLPDGSRREYVKPIMFSGGMGQMEHMHAEKGVAEVGLLVVKVGGPAYRIGMGGGAASSMMQGDNKSDLDFNAVQRGDAEMAQKVYRVLRACVEMGDLNPVVAIHDQGAGGNCNVVKELIYPAGATIDVRKIWAGDKSLSALELWGAEYQEQFGLLIRPEHEDLFRKLCERENVIPAVLGVIDGSGKVILWDEDEQKAVVDLDLEAVLGDLPQKTFTDQRVVLNGTPLDFGESGDNVVQVLDRVLGLLSVGSKRFLTTKVDRSVTGLVAQQQGVGPLHLPLSNYAVTAQSHFSMRGSATAIGERPTLASLSPAAMARMTIGEMMTNIAGAKVTSRQDIKCEGNWMWPAKLSGDCATLHDAAVAMRDVMVELGIAVDGGKDSLSMAAKCPMEDGGFETARAPGTLVVSGYCTMESVEVKATPDLKAPGTSVVLLVDIAGGARRLGGSSIAQVFGQVGDTSPDLPSATVLARAFDTVQELLGEGKLLAYHDVSDGGLLVALLEMGFAGNCGLDVYVDSQSLGVSTVAALFAEELGMLIEVTYRDADQVRMKFLEAGIECNEIARTRRDTGVSVTDRASNVLRADIRDLRDSWEKTSFALEKLQANEVCVNSEQRGLRSRKGPRYVVPWSPQTTIDRPVDGGRPVVGVVREEGSNGDREMSAAFHMAGFEVWDVCMRDIASGSVSLSKFNGLAFVGGFSFADVLDSAKGWAGVVRFNENVKKEFDEFYARDDTFSLGVCNGCQLMAMLGCVPFAPSDLESERQPRFITNESGRYESRFTTVLIQEDNPAIMLQGMGGAQLGVWVAHGEGRAYFPDETILAAVEERNLAPLRYLDDDGQVSTVYPFNPNGSVNGIGGMCSHDGRHLAMMPHPERTVLKWQWGYLSPEIEQLDASPWITMFQNAHDWVMSVTAE